LFDSFESAQTKTITYGFVTKGSIGARIEREVGSWDGVTVSPQRYGGSEFRVGRRELGPLHGSRVADLPFPVPTRRALGAARRAGRLADARVEQTAGYRREPQTGSPPQPHGNVGAGRRGGCGHAGAGRPVKAEQRQAGKRAALHAVRLATLQVASCARRL